MTSNAMSLSVDPSLKRKREKNLQCRTLFEGILLYQLFHFLEKYIHWISVNWFWHHFDQWYVFDCTQLLRLQTFLPKKGYKRHTVRLTRKVIALFCQEISSNQCKRHLMLFVSKEKNSKHFIHACHSSTRYPQLDSHGDAICTTTIEFLKRVDGNPKPYFDSYFVKRSLTLGCQESRSN